MSTLAELWSALSADTKRFGDCTHAALVLADALQERGDWHGELIALTIAAGAKATCPSNGDVEAQRLFRASHPPADMLRERNGRWQKRRHHAIYCNTYRKEHPTDCSCPVRTGLGPVLWKQWRQLDARGTEPGAWVFENRYSEAEPEGYVELRVEWTWTEEAELQNLNNLIEIALAMVVGPGVSNRDADHFVRLEARRYFEDWKMLPSKQHLARRLAAGYLRLDDLERRLSNPAQVEALERAVKSVRGY